MSFPRSSGLLLHPTSLPGPFGIGDFGPAAYEFADFLASAGQSIWQMLPLGPPDKYGSPYKSPSAFAASPALLESPRARVSKAEEDQFRERHSYWVDGWSKFAGSDAVADQVRFEREWGALRAYANSRGVRNLASGRFAIARCKVRLSARGKSPPREAGTSCQRPEQNSSSLKMAIGTRPVSDSNAITPSE